jgi:hypothetical protein
MQALWGIWISGGQEKWRRGTVVDVGGKRQLNSWKTWNDVKLGFHPHSANMYADRMEIWY